MSVALPPSETRVLRAYLGQTGFERLIAEGRKKVEHQGRVAGKVVLTGCTLEEAGCMAGLLGPRFRAPAPGGDASVDLSRVDVALRKSRFGVGLGQALELLGGPLADHRAARAELRDGRAAVWARAAEHPAAGDPAVAAWMDQARGRGGIARLAYEDDGLPLALDVAAQVPLAPPEAQTILAADLRGDAHALDTSTAAGQLLVSLLAHREGIPTPGEASERRALLERHGILTDSISCWWRSTCPWPATASWPA